MDCQVSTCVIIFQVKKQNILKTLESQNLYPSKLPTVHVAGGHLYSALDGWYAHLCLLFYFTIDLFSSKLSSLIFILYINGII